MAAILRLLPFRSADGPTNMAHDEVLLASAAAGTASLRFYNWSSATLSLGYFQASAPALAYPFLAGLPWLRRPTGGTALLHHHELTYALALPAAPFWQPNGSNWLLRMHEMIRTVLASQGVDVATCRHERNQGDVLCFFHHTPGDLFIDLSQEQQTDAPWTAAPPDEVGPHKVTGSAQRKQRGALLQHGSILLARSPFTPSLPGIAELSGVAIQAESLVAPLIEELSRSLSCTIEPEDWTPHEREQTAVALSRYTSDSWNRRR